MSAEYMPIARFPLPQNWTPEGTVCVLFRVPDDMEYIHAIIGLVDMLKWSRNFGRDPTATGAAIVSRTWQAALEAQPVQIGDCEDAFVSIDFRTKPGYPYITQCSTDGGTTWHDAYEQPHWRYNNTLSDGSEASGSSGSTGGDTGGDGDTEHLTATATQIMRRWYVYLSQVLDLGIEAGKTDDELEGDICTLIDTCPGVGPFPGSNPEIEDLIAATRALGHTDLLKLATQECHWMPGYNYLTQWLSDHPNDWFDNIEDVLAGVNNDLEIDVARAISALEAAMGFDAWYQWIQVPHYVEPTEPFGLSGDCGYALIYVGQWTDTRPAGSTAACHAFTWVVPDGYEFQGLYVQYNVAPSTGVYTGVFLGYGKECAAVPPERPLWTVTSQKLDSDHHVFLYRVFGVDDTIFTDQGLDISDAMTPEYVKEPQGGRLGPATFQASFNWHPVFNEGASGFVRLTAVVKKV
jgi:hypothetical protein